MIYFFKIIALGILAIGGYLLSQQYRQSNSLENFIYQHIQDGPVMPSSHWSKARAIQVKKTVSLTTTLHQLDKHLQAGESLQVLAKGMALLEADPDNIEVLLRTGIAHLKQQDDVLAYEQLNTVYTISRLSTLKVQAAWYLALLQAQKKQWKQSQQFVQYVLKQHSPYRHSAEQLSSQIKRQL